MTDTACTVPNVRDALRDLLVRSTATSAGYAVTGIAFGGRVEVTVAGDSPFVLQIRPGDAEPGFRRTNRFSISFRGAQLDRNGYAAVEAACEHIAAWERLLPAGADQLLFTPTPASQDTHAFELLAVRCGAKPTARIVVAPRAEQAVLEAARRHGLLARQIEARNYSGSADDLAHLRRTSATRPILVARSESELNALQQSEADNASPGDVGALLGYPPCCIDAFAVDPDQPKALIRFNALRRTGELASHLLNDVDGRTALVSHLVCRYDCAPSVDLARQVLQGLAAEDVKAAAAYAETTRGLVVAFSDGGSLRLEVGRESTPPRYDLGGVHPTEDGPSIWTWRAALIGADALEVADGWVVVRSGAGTCHRLEMAADRVQLRRFA